MRICLDGLRNWGGVVYNKEVMVFWQPGGIGEMGGWIGQTVAGRYHVDALLGEGGMATVYKAYDQRLESEVAVKVIRTEVFPPLQLQRVLGRFAREAKALARLTHPNIVKVIDYGEHDGTPYLVMPYLSGGTLRQRMGRKMTLEEAGRLLLPLMQALAYAHDEGLVHRDVKPGNILLSKSGQPMLADFGIVKIVEGEEMTHLTSTGMGVGTPEYMAPEQWRGEITPQVDVYALGVVLYEMLSGEKPYTGKTPGEVLLKQMSEPLPDVRQKAEGLSAAGAALVERALARDVSQRWGSMEEFAAALERALRGEEVERTETAPRPVAAVQRTPALEGDEETRDDLAVVRPLAVSVGDVAQQSLRAGGLPRWVWGLGLIGLVVVVLLVFAAGRAAAPLFATPTPTATATSTATPTMTPTPTATLGVGATMISEKDGMELVYVPAGEFEMGSQEGDYDERPVHTVYLDAYWIDRTEVTNAMYAKCVQDGACDEPGSRGSATRSDYYGNSSYADYPVINVDWHMADAYCRWAGRRLPSEAEWEKAARGTDGREYPWGDGAPSCGLANYDAGNYCVGDTSAVGSYPEGASPYGALDMAGNVWEWVADWYDANYYANSPRENPKGASSGEYRVVRGGSWYYVVISVRAANRGRSVPSVTNDTSDGGFRCALGTSP
ncbi:MAG: SUMF1/EgtB/PvdO family nonheme iron enzyme [Anaerolineae bacterium]|nr:SUMF1/EgtB/PvdO family nonheme iron enzyme [Anaerolineae bacterium]